MLTDQQMQSIFWCLFTNTSIKDICKKNNISRYIIKQFLKKSKFKYIKNKLSIIGPNQGIWTRQDQINYAIDNSIFALDEINQHKDKYIRLQLTFMPSLAKKRNFTIVEFQNFIFDVMDGVKLHNISKKYPFTKYGLVYLNMLYDFNDAFYLLYNINRLKNKTQELNKVIHSKHNSEMLLW